MAPRMTGRATVWRHRGGELSLDRTRIMGVLNVTPDSFSDGGRFFHPEDAIRRGIELADQGADLIDVGGESTRPRAEAVPADEEWRRVAPVLRALGQKVDVPLSIDTRKPEVAAKAIEAGAVIVNDVSGLRDPRMLPLIARYGVGVVLMHMQGEPETMQDRPAYSDVVREVRGFLETRSREAAAAQIPPESIAVDPGIGFGKTLEHNLDLLRGLGSIAELGHPVVIGVSRKSFLAKVGAGEAGERLPASVAAATLAVAHGAQIVRCHDVLETTRAMRVVDAVLRRT